jgi:hypothetical protein
MSLYSISAIMLCVATLSNIALSFILHSLTTILVIMLIEQRTLRNVNKYLITNIYSYLETSGGESSNLYLKVVHFFNTSAN